MCSGRGSNWFPVSTTAKDQVPPVHSPQAKEPVVSISSAAGGSSLQHTGEKLSAQEKYQLMAQYDCEYSDEEEIQYLFFH